MADEVLVLWADEGGYQLRLSHSPSGGVTFEVWNGDERSMSATLASFRLRRVADFLAPGIAHEQSLYDLAHDDERQRPGEGAVNG